MGFSHENDNSLADALWLKNNFAFRPPALCGVKTILFFVLRHSVVQKQFCFSSAGTLWLKNNFAFRPPALCGSKTILFFVRRHSVVQKQFCFSSADTLWLKNNFVFRPLALCGSKTILFFVRRHSVVQNGVCPYIFSPPGSIWPGCWADINKISSVRSVYSLVIVPV